MAVLLLCCVWGTDVSAQVARHHSALAAAPPTAALALAAAPSSPVAALGIEALGGIAGAALGYGALMLTGDDLCGEDLTCTLRNAGAALLLGTTGAGVTHGALAALGSRAFAAVR